MPFALLPQSDADTTCPVFVDEDDAGLLKGALNLPDVPSEAACWHLTTPREVDIAPRRDGSTMSPLIIFMTSGPDYGQGEVTNAPVGSAT